MNKAKCIKAKKRMGWVYPIIIFKKIRKKIIFLNTIFIKKIITKLVIAVNQDVYAPRWIQSLGASNRIETDTITITTCQTVR